MLNNPTMKLAVALALTCSAALTAQAQDAGALVDALVRKGVLTDQEAEEVRADMTRDFAQTNAGKINLSSSMTELKLYGDFRYRWQYDDRQPQVANPSNVSQRSRHRFRLRLNADIALTDGFFAGFALESGQASDSGNQTFENGFDDYNIFISKAFLGWKPNDWFTVTLGKFKNPFYTTDLVWDADINPQGAMETIAFHKMPMFGGSGGPTGDVSKDGKTFETTDVRSEPNWELTLVAGQFVFDDNNEFNLDNDLSTDAYLFVEQLIATWKFNKDTSITIAPGFMTFTAADLTGLLNENAFTDASAVGTLLAISGETRQLHILTAPGDLSFKLAGIKTKLYWDAAYNLGGRQRFEDIYQLYAPRTQVGMQFSERDAFAWLVGLQLGETKKKGDWLAYVNYRETGIASVDPNLNESDFAFGELNTRGFKIGLAYALSDAVIFNVTGYLAWNLNEDLAGGRATAAPAVAQDNASNVVQVDLNVKF